MDYEMRPLMSAAQIEIIRQVAALGLRYRHAMFQADRLSVAFDVKAGLNVRITYNRGTDLYDTQTTRWDRSYKLTTSRSNDLQVEHLRGLWTLESR